MPRTTDSSGLTGFAIPGGIISATVSSNALTIEIKTATGTDPSPTDPLLTAFQDSTGTAWQGKLLTTPLTLVVPSGARLGTDISTPFRLWILLFNDSDVYRLGVVNCYSINAAGAPRRAIRPLNESVPQSATAIDASADDAGGDGVIYAPAAITAKPFRIVGFLDYNTGLATPGAWSAAPDSISHFGMGGKRPGEEVQSVTVPDPFVRTTSPVTRIPYDNTIPQNSEGGLVYGTGAAVIADITPTSAINVVEFDGIFNVSYSVAARVLMALFKGTATDAFAVALGYVPVADATVQVSFRTALQALQTTAMDLRLRMSGDVAGTLSVNGDSGGAKFASKTATLLRLREVMV